MGGSRKWAAKGVTGEPGCDAGNGRRCGCCAGLGPSGGPLAWPAHPIGCPLMQCARHPASVGCWECRGSVWAIPRLPTAHVLGSSPAACEARKFSGRPRRGSRRVRWATCRPRVAWQPPFPSSPHSATGVRDVAGFTLSQATEACAAEPAASVDRWSGVAEGWGRRGPLVWPAYLPALRSGRCNSQTLAGA